jgi:ubiquinone/menaquinone biosynthesis C-methylase UbiE
MKKNNSVLKASEPTRKIAAERPGLYVLKSGDKGADRLKLLNNAYWPTSKIALEQAGLKKGMSYCDVGCGAGDMILRVANLLEKEGHFTGIDIDARSIEIAKKLAAEAKIKAEFKMMDIETPEKVRSSMFDFVYSRSVLTHLKNPLRALELMVESAKVGGIIAVEDIEFTGSFSYPNCPSYYKFTELYQSVVKGRGADPNIGPKLFGMFQKLGIKDLQISVSQPTFYEGDGKLIAHVTMEHIREAVLSSKLAENSEIDQIIDDMKKFAESSQTLMSFPRVFQVWGRK